MTTVGNNTKNTRNVQDNEILKRPSVVAWLATLEKEFAIHHSSKSTQKMMDA